MVRGFQSRKLFREYIVVNRWQNPVPLLIIERRGFQGHQTSVKAVKKLRVFDAQPGVACFQTHVHDDSSQIKYIPPAPEGNGYSVADDHVVNELGGANILVHAPGIHDNGS
jgi:hypothetical protein